MNTQSRNGQRGASLLGMLFVGIVLAVIGVVGAQILPTTMEYFAIQKAVNKAKEGTTVAEVRTIFDKAASIDMITSITGKDLDVSKEADKVVVAFAYERAIHLAGPGWLVLRYSGQSN